MRGNVDRGVCVCRVAEEGGQRVPSVCVYAGVCMYVCVYLTTEGVKGATTATTATTTTATMRRLGGATAVPLALVGLLQPDPHRHGSLFLFPDSDHAACAADRHEGRTITMITSRVTVTVTMITSCSLSPSPLCTASTSAPCSGPRSPTHLFTYYYNNNNNLLTVYLLFT